jgi:hypothetical protein
MRRCLLLTSLVLSAALSASSALKAQTVQPFDYHVLATNKTSTMEKELNQAAAIGYRFSYVMGGETAFGGHEVVTIMTRTGSAQPHYEYKLLATSKTSTMQKELQQASDAGYEYRGQTVFESTFGGKEVSCIMERDLNQRQSAAYKYLLVATSKTSTMDKELKQAGEQGYEAVGMTIGKTAMGGNELVTIMRIRLK